MGQDTGTVAVKRIVVSNDCGPISNPDGLRNQLEGGNLQGMSRALGEKVTWDDEKVTSFDWRTYHSLPLGFDVPKIETVLVNRPNEEATGAGETSITIIAAGIEMPSSTPSARASGRVPLRRSARIKRVEPTYSPRGGRPPE